MVYSADPSLSSYQKKYTKLKHEHFHYITCMYVYSILSRSLYRTVTLFPIENFVRVFENGAIYYNIITTKSNGKIRWKRQKVRGEKSEEKCNA